MNLYNYKYILFIILTILSIFLFIYYYGIYTKLKYSYCYDKCSEYHYLNESKHWYFEEFLIDSNDTIWIDEECYNNWCICIDECYKGLCCELLKKE